MIFFSFSKTAILFSLFSLIIGMCSCGSKQKKIKASDKPAGPPPPMRVEGYIVKMIALSEDLELPGTVIANEAGEIHPEVSGRLTYLNAAEGKTVGKGTLIAKTYDGDLAAQLNKLQIQQKVQQKTTERYRQLLDINGVSRQEYDMQTLSINNLRADMEIVRSNIRRTEIRAPFSGTLGLKMVSPGAYVSPQTVITTIRQNTQLKIDFTLPERYISKLTNGQLVDFAVEGNQKKYTAKVIATEMGISENNRALKVRALVIQNDGKILPGTFVKITTKFEPDPNAIMIPTQAIVPQARGKKVIVYRAGTVSFDDVETGIRDSSMVQVTAGLKVGDTIITTGIMGLKPKSKVIITKVNK